MQNQGGSKQGTGEETSNGKIVSEFFTDGFSGKIRKDHLAPNFTGRSPRGQFDRESYIQSLSAFTSAFPDARLSIDDTIVKGDKVVIVGTIQGTHKGEFMGLQPTGKKITTKVIHVDHVLDGNIVQDLGLWDTGDFMRQIKPD